MKKIILFIGLAIVGCNVFLYLHFNVEYAEGLGVKLKGLISLGMNTNEEGVCARSTLLAAGNNSEFFYFF